MPASFRNISAVAKILSDLSLAPSFSGNVLFEQLMILSELDRARAIYYPEESSQKIFDWVQQYRALESFYGTPLPAQIHLENTPFSEDEWASLLEKARGMTEGFVEGDYILDRIDTWILESYSLSGECEVESGDIVFDCGACTGNPACISRKKQGKRGEFTVSRGLPEHLHSIRKI